MIDFLDSLRRTRVSDTAKKYFNAANIAFLFWLVMGVKPFITFLFFQNIPKIGTAVGMLLTLSMACLVILLIISKGWPRRLFAALSLGEIFVLGYLGWCGVSLGWSQARSILVVGAYWFIMTVEVLIVLLLCHLENCSRVFEKSLWGMAMGSLLMVLVSLGSGEHVVGRLGNASFLNPNVIGYYVGLGVLACLYAFFSSVRWRFSICWLVVFILLMVALVESLSKTSIIAFFGALFVLIFFSKFAWKKKILILLLTLFVFSANMPSIFAYLDQYRHEENGQAMVTLTGRTIFWNDVWEMIKEKPVLGYGFMSLRDIAPQKFSKRIVHAHNEWLQVWFSQGLIGILLGICLYLNLFVCVVKGFNRLSLQPPQVVSGALLVFCLIRGLAEADVMGLVFPLPLMVLVFSKLSSKVVAGCENQSCP